MTPEQIEKLKAKYADFRKHWPDAVFSPWDSPPMGLRIRKEHVTGTVIGVDDIEWREGNLHSNCQTCSCPNQNPFFGWWKVKWEDYKDQDGTPFESLEYPPAWVPVKD